MPAIVSEQMFKEVQDILSRRKRGPIRRNNFYLLTGFIFCGLCGSAYVGSKSSPKHAYYACSRKKNIMDCNNINVLQKNIEALAVSKVKQLIKNVDLEEITQVINEYIIAESNDIKSNRERIKAEIVSLTQKIDNLLDVIETGGANEVVKARLRDHSERKKQLEEQLSLVPKEKNITIEDIKQKLDMLDPEGKTNQQLREIFTQIELKIYIYPEATTITFGQWHNVNDASPTPTLCKILVKMLV